MFECDDIFRCIILALEGPGSGQALAALAITCKALSEAALDAIWEHLLDFERVLELFPQDLFVESEWSLARPIMPTDWDRPRFYAARVKTLKLDADHDEVLKVMGPFYPSGGLLPNLRRLSRGSSNIWPDLTPLRVLLHLQLKEVSFSCSPSITHLSFLSALPVLCPHLTFVDLRFDGENNCPETAAVVSTLVPALQTLESLRLNLDIHVGELNLGLLPNLTALDLTGLTVAGSFPRLRDLTVNSVDAVSAIKLLSSTAILGLVKIDLSVCPAPTSPQVAELVRALKSVASSTSLKTLSLSLLPADDMPADVMKAQTLRELSFFSGLKSVHIEWFFGPDLDDRTLEHLTISWTQLTNLHLIQRGTDTNLTLKSLLALARNCPHLQDLTLKFDASEVPEPSRVAPQRCLESIDLELSPIQNATKVARYLSGIFPDIERIWSERSEESSEPNPLWDQVSEQLPEFVAVRKEEAEKVESRLGGDADGLQLVS
ncbi:hypothetical protein C8R45DRAFT_1107781 [Mycena sanguinolenta]|nr:hypothetical protein C8R45DRAFT_1107781 [Mycena sanguinolenta]